MDVCHVLLGRPWKNDNDIIYRGRYNVMMLMWRTHKIDMASVLHFDKNSGEKKSSFLVMTLNEQEFDETVKETKCFSSVVTSGLLRVVKEESTIP